MLSQFWRWLFGRGESKAAPPCEEAPSFRVTPAETVVQAPAWLKQLPSRIAFLDVETTGLHSDDRIVSLACIAFNSENLVLNNVNVQYEYLIFDPGKKCHPEASRIHGFDDWTLRHQPFFSNHAEEIREFLEGADLLVAHNAEFDFPFLNRELEAAGLAPLSRPTFCTMKGYRSRFSGRANLNAVAAQMGMARSSNSHGALEDACLAMNIFLWLHNCPKRFPISVFSGIAIKNLQPVPAMPVGELPPRKRRPRRRQVGGLDPTSEPPPVAVARVQQCQGA